MSADQQPRGGTIARSLIVVGILAAAAGIWFGVSFFQEGLQQRPSETQVETATLLPQPKPIVPVSLTDQDEEPFTLGDLAGRWVFLSFGYTYCPDVCPMTLATFVALDRQISPEGADAAADFLFVSVDPERDSPQRLGQYVHHFNPRFLGATGSHEALHALTAQLGVLYARAEGRDSALDYLVDHSASILLLDPRGRLAAIFSRPHDPAAMARDFATIRGNDDK